MSGFGLCGGSDLGRCLLVGDWCFAVCRAHGVCLLYFFSSGVRFCLLLGPCLCFVSFLCLDVCVLGDDALMGWASFMRARYLCILGRIWIGGEVGAVGPV